MINVEFEVYDFQDDGVDFGYYVNAKITGFEINGETDCQNEEINDVFANFGVTIDFPQMVIENGGYIDKWENYKHVVINEYFFKNEDDAKFVARMLQTLINPILKRVN